MNKAHCIGICGKGMSAVAHLLLEKGWTVSGSDQGFYPPVSDYVDFLDVETHTGYKKENIPEDVDLIIIGKNAKLIPETNEEVAYAFEHHRDKIKSFPEVINSMIADTTNLVVAGSYGKSTTTALLSWALRQSDLDPSYLIGEAPTVGQHSSHLGEGKHFVLEGDEYPSANWDDRSKFMHYDPSAVLLTSACHDHVNIYPTQADYLKPFTELLGLVKNDGVLVACIDEEYSQGLYESHAGNKVSYGFSEEADWTMQNLHFNHISAGDIYHNSELVVRVETSLLGKHNLQNILGVAALVLGQGIITPEQFAAAVKSFTGLVRRLDRKVSDDCAVHVYEGYGTSYEKARSAIEAMKLHFTDSRLVVLFEPHTFTWRNKTALDQYHTAFNDVDTVYIYEPPTQGATTHAQASLEEIITKTKEGHADVRAFNAESMDQVVDDLSKDDVLLLLSSGNFDGLQQVIIDKVDQNYS